MYTNFLETLIRYKPQLRPKKLMIDFESSFELAFSDCFPRAKISECFFHFCQSVWRHVQQCGLQREYNMNAEFAVHVRMLNALAFVPEGDVVVAYEELVKSNYYDANEEILSGLLAYFELTWVGTTSRSRKRRNQPIFAISMWNYYDTVMSDDIKSNNNIEGWHNSFNGKVKIRHANIGKFLNVIKAEQNLSELLIAQMDTGLHVAATRRTKYQQFNERLKNIVLSYDANDKLKYLHNAASILKY